MPADANANKQMHHIQTTQEEQCLNISNIDGDGNHMENHTLNHLEEVRPAASAR